MPEKYDKIGLGYNLSRAADPYLIQQLYKLLGPTKTGSYLDLGCGTGNYTIALQKMGVQFIGIDPSTKMLNAARSKSTNIQWLEGQAEDIPLNDNSVEGAICTLTLHHWKNLSKAFKELNRVLKNKAKVVIFTSTPEQMLSYWLNHYFPKMMKNSIAQMPSYDTLRKAMQENGFGIYKAEKYFVKPDLKDLFLYAGKRNPKLYLNPQVRQGISSFTALANGAEVEHGLSQLEADIQTGAIHEVIDSFENSLGDYLFLVAEKL